MYSVNLLLVLGCLFIVAAGIFDWDWFMTHRKAAIVVNLLGRNGARIFYIVIGIIMAVIGFKEFFGA
jgi:small neutral amino acid transporter SnatA (MarC family)